MHGRGPDGLARCPHVHNSARRRRSPLPPFPPLTQKQNTNTNGKKTVSLCTEKMSENCTDLVVREEIVFILRELGEGGMEWEWESDPCPGS